MSSLESALAENQAAVNAFIARASAVPATAWTRPAGPGKWSPGQVAEHVAISYGISSQVMRGTSTLPAFPRLLRPLIRALFLPKLLRTGAFPKGAKAPKAFQPPATPADCDAVTGRLKANASQFEKDCRDAVARSSPKVDHPVFGALPVEDYLRVSALHTAHHSRQIPGSQGG
jgi:hypothetical protein